MSKMVVFDIETYRPNWQIRRSRREDLDPNKNFVITVGLFDGKNIAISPVSENLIEEEKHIEFFKQYLEEWEVTALVGFNILHFDIPYLVHKSEQTRRSLSITQYEVIDLYWFMPYWLHNLPSGKEVYSKSVYLGNLWRFEEIAKRILNQQANPVSNKEIFRLWDEKQFSKIEKHLEIDLTQTFRFFNSQTIQESLREIENSNFDRYLCSSSCPFMRQLQRSTNKASKYCTLLREIKAVEKNLAPVDVICSPLPARGISWIPPCLGK